MYKPGPVLIFPSAAEKAAANGRPSLRTPETVAKICAAIRESGHTATHAAALAGVSSSAVSRWRQEDEESSDQLDAARAEYLDARLKTISETCKRDGSPDWRAQAWLMQAVAPGCTGRLRGGIRWRGRRRRKRRRIIPMSCRGRTRGVSSVAAVFHREGKGCRGGGGAPRGERRVYRTVGRGLLGSQSPGRCAGADGEKSLRQKNEWVRGGSGSLASV
jgi:hypothetical protein